MTPTHLVERLRSIEADLRDLAYDRLRAAAEDGDADRARRREEGAAGAASAAIAHGDAIADASAE